GNGVAIVRSYTSSAWWHAEMPRAELILFPRGKTKFHRPDGSIGPAPGHRCRVRAKLHELGMVARRNAEGRADSVPARQNQIPPTRRLDWHRAWARHRRSEEHKSQL